MSQELRIELQQILDDYSVSVTEAIREEALSVAKDAVKDIKASRAWKDYTGEYRKGWKVVDASKGMTVSVFVANTGKHGGLSHLLENGHPIMTRDGSVMIKARPHIAPVNETAQAEFIQKVQKILEDGT